jgi:undecaprenyl-diphosphatase
LSFVAKIPNMSSIPLDVTLFTSIHSVTNCSGSPWDQFNLFISNNSAFLWFFFIFVLALLNGKKGWYAGLMCFAGFIIAWHISDEYLKPFFNVPRPFLALNGSCVYGFKPSTASFPSGHMLTCSAMAMLVYLYNKKNYFAWILGFAFALLVGYTRMYLGVHFPTDIIGGAFFGVVIALIWYYATEQAHKYCPNLKLADEK